MAFSIAARSGKKFLNMVTPITHLFHFIIDQHNKDINKTFFQTPLKRTSIPISLVNLGIPIQKMRELKENNDISN